MSIWNPCTKEPRPLETILIAREDSDNSKNTHIEYGLFMIDKEGRLIDEKTKVQKVHFGNYLWAYEVDVIDNNRPPLHIEVSPMQGFLQRVDTSKHGLFIAKLRRSVPLSVIKEETEKLELILNKHCPDSSVLVIDGSYEKVGFINHEEIKQIMMSTPTNSKLVVPQPKSASSGKKD